MADMVAHHHARAGWDVAKLDKTIEIMAISQLNYNLTTEEKENILAFLKSLTGKVDEKFKKAPIN